MNLVYWIHRPHLLVARLRYWLWERRHPDLPWLSRGAIEFCDANLNRNMLAVEFGSGRSTAWFARRVGKLISIEHIAAWHQRVFESLKSQGIDNVDYRLIPLDHSESMPERETYDLVPAYVAVIDALADGSLDSVVIDGHYRTHCIRHSLSKLKPGALLLVDDVSMWSATNGPPVPGDWKIVSRSSNGLKETVIWRKPDARIGA